MTTHYRINLRQLSIHTAFVLLASLLLTSCIAEDRSDCPQTTILFHYDADGTRNVIGKYIDKAVIYVFDYKTGDYVGHTDVDKDALISTEPMPLYLPEGIYRFVVWGGEGMRTTLPDHGENFGESILSHPLYHKGQNSVLDTHDNLYFATAIIDMTPRTEPYVLDFRSAHANIEIYIKGWPKADSPQIFLHGFTPEYDFSSIPVNVGEISYQPAVTRVVDKDYYMSHLASLRFYKPTTSTLEVKSGDGAFSQKFPFWDYVEKYAKHENIVLSQTEELTIPVLVEIKGTTITINIPRWESGDVLPDL